MNEKCNRKHQQQNESSRKKNLCVRREDLWNYPVGEGERKKNEKIVKNVYVIYGISLKETICKLLESQKEKRGRKEQKDYLKK